MKGAVSTKSMDATTTSTDIRNATNTSSPCSSNESDNNTTSCSIIMSQYMSQNNKVIVWN